jgi:hypothetical protein
LLLLYIPGAAAEKSDQGQRPARFGQDEVKKAKGRDPAKS